MRWFEGNISDAVALSKSRKAIFVVFVEGTDNASQTLLSAIDSIEVSSKLQSNVFVAIKLGSGTESYRQFAQIYQVVPVPSLFFIGRDGRPLEIVGAASTSAEILNRIDTVLAKNTESPGSNGAVPVQGSTPSTSEPTRTTTVDTSSKTTELPQQRQGQDSSFIAPSTSVAAGGTDMAHSVAAEDEDADAKDRIEAAKALIEKNRLKKLEEEKAKGLEQEMERRKVGQEVQRLRRWQQDQEYKQLKEEREREKREEAAARERVRNQIAQDKAERAKRNNQVPVQEKEPEKQVENIPMPIPRSDTARLQLRFPDGNTVTHQLPCSASLRELRAFISERLNQSPANFSLSTTFPRRVLSVDEDSQTMSELELVPTAVVLILPASSGGIVRSGGSASSAITPVTQMFWALLTPILSIFTYIKNMLFGQGVARGSGTSSDARSQRRSPSEPSAQGPTRRIPATSEIRRQGNSNIHRLAQTQDSSDEDNNTWNGNSTQQM